MSRVVLLRFDERMAEPLRARVLEVVGNRFAETGVWVTSDPDLARALGDPVELRFLGELVAGPDLGRADPDHRAAEVYVANAEAHFAGVDEGHLADILGTLGAHEAGHVLLPLGHSVVTPNLMSPGHRVIGHLEVAPAVELQFTDLQRALLARDDSFGAPSLADVELAALGATTAEAVELAELGTFIPDADALSAIDPGALDLDA